MTLCRVLFATAFAGLLSTACTGILEPRGGGGGGDLPDAGPIPDAPVGDTPQALFNSTVRDRLGTKCVPCHVDGGTQPPLFLAQTADNYYTFLMTGYPNDWIGTTPDESIVYTKGLLPHAGGIVWDAAEQGYIYDWIVAEYEDRSGGGGAPVLDPDAANCVGDLAECALANFAKCFDYNNWNNKQIYQIANVQSATGQCKVCHSNGTGGFYSSDDSLATYRKWKESGYIEGVVSAALDGQGQFAGLVPSYAIEEKGADPNHPTYTLDAIYTQNLNAFVQETLNSFSAAPCDDNPGQ